MGIYLYFRHAASVAVRRGGWKLVRVGNPSGFYSTKLAPGTTELYNLESDPSETNDLSDSRPLIVDDLHRVMTKHEVRFMKPQWGQFGRRDRNYLDQFTYMVPVGETGKGLWSDKRAWDGLNAIDSDKPYGERMTTQDGNANTVLEFPVSNSNSYVATNDLVRLSGLEFMANQIRLTGRSSVAGCGATIQGKDLLLVNSLAETPAGIQLDSTATADASFPFRIALNLQLYDDLLISGDGDNPLTIDGVISDYGEARSVTKKGKCFVELAGDNTYSGATRISEGELRLTGSMTTSMLTIDGGKFSGTGTMSLRVREGGIGCIHLKRGNLDITNLSIQFIPTELASDEYCVVNYSAASEFTHSSAPSYFGEVKNLPAGFALFDTGHSLNLVRTNKATTEE